MVEHLGPRSDEWRAEHAEPLAIEGRLAIWADGSITIDVGDGTLRPLGGVIADYFESRPDPMGDRLRRHRRAARRSARDARPASELE